MKKWFKKIGQSFLKKDEAKDQEAIPAVEQKDRKNQEVIPAVEQKDRKDQEGVPLVTQLEVIKKASNLP